MRAGGGTDPFSGNTFTSDTYTRRNPFSISWGATASDVPTTSESTWDIFYQSGAIDVDPQSVPQSTGSAGLITNPLSLANAVVSSSASGIIGPGIASSDPIEYTATLPDGRTVYCAQNVVDGYTTNIVMVTSDGEARYIPTASTGEVDIQSFFDATQWSTYGIAPGYSIVNSS